MPPATYLVERLSQFAVGFQKEMRLMGDQTAHSTERAVKPHIKGRSMKEAHQGEDLLDLVKRTFLRSLRLGSALEGGVDHALVGVVLTPQGCQIVRADPFRLSAGVHAFEVLSREKAEPDRPD